MHQQQAELQPTWQITNPSYTHQNISNQFINNILKLLYFIFFNQYYYDKLELDNNNVKKKLKNIKAYVCLYPLGSAEAPVGAGAGRPAYVLG